MKKLLPFLYASALLAVLVAGLVTSPAGATETTARLVDRSIARVESSVTDVDISAADYTSYQTLLTFEPNGVAAQDVKFVFDLDTGDDADGFAGANSSSETITFALARKIQGKWRIDDEVETTAVGENNAGDRSVTLSAGVVGPDEDCRVYVKVSAEGADFECAYLCLYRSSESATFTNVAN